MAEISAESAINILSIMRGNSDYTSNVVLTEGSGGKQRILEEQYFSDTYDTGSKIRLRKNYRSPIESDDFAAISSVVYYLEAR